MQKKNVSVSPGLVGSAVRPLISVLHALHEFLGKKFEK